MMEARTFTRSATSVKQARRFVTDQLMTVPEDIATAVTLMVSELATNSIRHADVGFTVTVDVGTDHVRVVVADSGPGAPELLSPTPSNPTDADCRSSASCPTTGGSRRHQQPARRSGSPSSSPNTVRSSTVRRTRTCSPAGPRRPYRAQSPSAPFDSGSASGRAGGIRRRARLNGRRRRAVSQPGHIR